MIKEIFPEGDAVFRNKPHTPEFFTLTIDEIDKAGESFIGILKVDESDAAYFLFFLRGDAYAAGYIVNGKPMPLSIKDFLQHLATEKKRTLSLYKTDPVLLKGMLVFLQKEPSIKATTDMIDFDGILNQIRKDKAVAFVVLKRNNMHSFFYFHSGEAKVAHFSDTARPGEEVSLIEQIMFYAYPADKTPVEVMVYRDIKTSEASDMAEVKPVLVADALLHEQKEAKPSPVVPAAQEIKEEKPVRARIEITDGPQKGNKFNVPLPCTIGRRDADIRVRDMTVSKRHASLEVSGEKIIFRDMGSTNGSMVNGREVKEIALSDGDIIQMGNTTLKVQFIRG